IGISAALFFALLLTPIAGEIAGGCVMGLLLSVLLPQRLLLRRRPRAPETAKRIPPGSTRSFVPSPALILVTLLIAGSIHAAAQEDPASARKNAVAEESEQPLDVLIPVDAAGNPADKVPLVYLPEPLLARLWKLQRTRVNAPPYLLSSTQYEGTIAADHSLHVRAVYRIRMLSKTEAAVSVALPLSGVNLAGPAACLVD